MKKYQEIKEVRNLISKYDVFFIDLWGVVHNGVNLFGNTLDVLKRIKQEKKKIFFLTNAPRRAYVISDQLKKFGLSEDLYDFIVSSGELTWLSLKKKKYEKKRGFQIGPERDFHLIEGLDIQIVNKVSLAEIIINTGPWGDNDKLENYTSVLNKLCESNALMICSNPDKTVIRGEKFMICAGLLAEYYQKIGGKVEYFGKPHKKIYEFCYKKIKKDMKILVIGDSLENDIRGANKQNLDSLLITDGIHREVNNNNIVDKEKLDGLIKKKNAFPNFFMQKLTY